MRRTLAGAFGSLQVVVSTTAPHSPLRLCDLGHHQPVAVEDSAADFLGLRWPWRVADRKVCHRGGSCVIRDATTRWRPRRHHRRHYRRRSVWLVVELPSFLVPPGAAHLPCASAVLPTLGAPSHAVGDKYTTSLEWALVPRTRVEAIGIGRGRVLGPPPRARAYLGSDLKTCSKARRRVSSTEVAKEASF